ncbi:MULTISPECIES: hypothetical protein [Catenuloplanes]|uniref:Uncharacterized protein n=1 Tax=Catenuloplanes niger TaxID=587534 RepID=A0AAE3ZKI1_9ACTN|nr:hypothetical protein [Catenuloplanes niger]MDR7320911.1 hypothetical protein [Catenuloplanes niger]
MRDVHDTELLVRRRAAAVAGLDGPLGTLHRQIRCSPLPARSGFPARSAVTGPDPRLGLLRPGLDSRLDPLRPARIRIDARDRGLVLVPLVFGGDRLMAAWDERAVYVACPARGARSA